MKLLKYLSFLSLPILTVSFAHAYENDWGQWQDDSFKIESIESTNNDLHNSVDLLRKSNKKGKSKKNHGINSNDYRENNIQTFSEPAFPLSNQLHDNSQYNGSDISDYENKIKLSSDNHLLDQPLEFGIFELENNIELPEIEIKYNSPPFNSDYEQTKFNEGAEPPEFDYQDYEYKIKIPSDSDQQPT